MKEKLKEAAQNQDHLKTSDILYGTVWDNASFLSEEQELQQNRRIRYAKGLLAADQINTDCDTMYIKNLLGIFSGMIITTCQDETIESFLEYRKSMPVDDIVSTPYLISTSSRWDHWIQTGTADLTRYFTEAEMKEDVYLLIKLYGSRNMPHKMLLSEQDFEAYYPQSRRAHTKMTEFLDIIFQTKNLLFLGVDFDEKSALPLAPGITKRLSVNENGKERYAVSDVSLGARLWKEYQIQPICAEGIQKLTNELCGRLHRTKLPKKELPNGNERLYADKALEEFGRYYVRRPMKGFFPKEKYDNNTDERMKQELYLLKNRILGTDDDKETPKTWNYTSIWQLAAAANNFADFYDLYKIFRMEEEAEKSRHRQPQTDSKFYEHVTANMLNDRLSRKSLELYRILFKYGEGFPWGFLPFLSDNEEELKEWKRAGIRLANSGIYVKRQHRKTIQRRMSYADSVMLSAGHEAYHERQQFQRRIGQISQQTGSSYFYPFEKVQIGIQAKDDQTMALFVKMFQKMWDILKGRREEYQQLHSLLQTETDTIFHFVIHDMDACDRELEWKPSFLYELLLESRMMPVRSESLYEIIDKIDGMETELRKMDEKRGIREAAQAGRKIFENRMYLCQIEIILLSHLLGRKKRYRTQSLQKKITCKCNKVSVLLKYKMREAVRQGNGSVPEWLFLLQLRFLIVKSDIYKRLSSVAEIERCKIGKRPDTLTMTEHKKQEKIRIKKQEDALHKMKKHLDLFEKILKDKEESSGCAYEIADVRLAHLKGQYEFKISQLYWEHRDFAQKCINFAEYKKEEEIHYQEAEREYRQALDYYDKYPSRYAMQRADVMRDMADLYCQQWKSMGGVVRIQKETCEKADCARRKCEKEVCRQRDCKKNNCETEWEERRKKIRQQCYSLLFEAYLLYRNHSDLHGIADVLQSMGNAETFEHLHEQNKRRSPFSFHQAAKDIYKELGDEWSGYVVEEFVNGVLYDRGIRTVQVERQS